jgi:hypothetical protein
MEAAIRSVWASAIAFAGSTTGGGARRAEDVEDGVIWVYGVGDDGAMAFTDFGIENLIDLIKIHKDDPTLLKRRDGDK